MSPLSFPRLRKAWIVWLDPESGALQRSIALQSNPNSVTRAFQSQGVNAEGGGGDRSGLLRPKKPPVESSKLDAEI